MSDANDLLAYAPYSPAPAFTAPSNWSYQPPTASPSPKPGQPVAGAAVPNPYAGRGGDFTQPENEMTLYNAGVVGKNYGMTPGTPGAPDYNAMAMADVRRQNEMYGKWRADQGLYEDEPAIDRATQKQWDAWQNSKFKGHFNSPDLPTVMSHKGQVVTPPNIKRLSYLPGTAPDTVFDIETGDIYTYGRDGKVTYKGNLNMPHVSELERGTSAVVANLRRAGVLADPTPHPLRGDHGWHSKTSSRVPSEADLRRIDPNNPTLDDIALNLSHESGTAWAQIDRSTKRAIGIGSVLATVAIPTVGGYTSIAMQGASPFLQAAVGAGAGATAGGSAMLAGQFIGHNFDPSKIDWNTVVRSFLTGAAGSLAASGASGLTGWLGGGPVVSKVAGDVASMVTRQGVGNVLPTTPMDIRAYQPYPGMSPEGARRTTTRFGGY